MVKYATSLSRESIVDSEGKAAERLETLYPTLKELTLAGSSGSVSNLDGLSAAQLQHYSRIDVRFPDSIEGYRENEKSSNNLRVKAGEQEEEPSELQPSEMPTMGRR
ncbi:hypothetical protein M5K25_025060 [Dendrobium thyrsiflorum]|uniref:Uncharacterized protein n=1 Tax=Dendrobium thyrsiflorum TaxID=117978 RepID=A0ABD0U3J7_DENTH